MATKIKKAPVKQPENITKQPTEAPAKTENLVDTLYLLTEKGVEVYYDRKGNDIIRKIREGNDAPYTFYEDGKRPVYVAVKNGTIGPLTFPKPEDYGITSSKLFAMADTYASVIAKFIELRIKGKPSLLSQIRQIGVIAGPMIVIALVILVIIAMMGG